MQEQAKVETKIEGQNQRPDRNNSKVRQRRKDGKPFRKIEKDEFDHKIVHIRRVSRMFKGGRRMRLSVVVVVGDKAGRVGIGLGKGADVKSAQDKAVKAAKTNLIFVPLKGNTIPHETFYKYGSAKVWLKPAAPGTGVIAGSSMRMVAEMAGVNDLLGKILGTNNKISNAYATVKALESLRLTRI